MTCKLALWCKICTTIGRESQDVGGNTKASTVTRNACFYLFWAAHADSLTGAILCRRNSALSGCSWQVGHWFLRCSAGWWWQQRVCCLQGRCQVLLHVDCGHPANWPYVLMWLINTQPHSQAIPVHTSFRRALDGVGCACKGFSWSRRWPLRGKRGEMNCVCEVLESCAL